MSIFLHVWHILSQSPDALSSALFVDLSIVCKIARQGKGFENERYHCAWGASENFTPHLCKSLLWVCLQRLAVICPGVHWSLSCVVNFLHL